MKKRPTDDRNSLTRVELLRTAGLVVSGIALGGTSISCASSNSGGDGGGDSDQELTVVDPGGDYGEALKKLFYEPFTEQTGVKITQVAAIADQWAKVQAQTESGEVSWDVVAMGEIDLNTRRQFLEKLDCSRIPEAAAQNISGVCREYGIMRHFSANVVAYNTDEFSPDSPPQTWADFWDVDRFPGPRSMNNVGAPWFNLWAALLADGAKEDSLIPIDLDRAFDKLDEIKPHIAVWWESGDQSQQIMRSGEVVLSEMWYGRALSIKEEGVPVDFSFDRVVGEPTYWGVLKGTPHREAAIEFLNFFLTRPQAHADFYQQIHYPTPNSEAISSLTQSEQEDNLLRLRFNPVSGEECGKLSASA